MHFDKILERNTYVQRFNPGDHRVVVRDELVDTAWTGLSYQSQFVIELKVQVSFWANKAQYQLARRQAERVLVGTLYADELRMLDQAVHAIYNHDLEIAVQFLEKIRGSITGDNHGES